MAAPIARAALGWALAPLPGERPGWRPGGICARR